MKSGYLGDQYLPGGRSTDFSQEITAKDTTPIVQLDPESEEYKERFNKLPKGWKEYITGEGWKCADSPTGAHHWLRVNEYFIWVCIWCCGRKKMPTRTYALDVALGMEIPQKVGNMSKQLEGEYVPDDTE